MYAYPPAYHRAVSHLIQFGPWNNTAQGRQLCADALRTIRRRGDFAQARREGFHLRYLCGMFPPKTHKGS